MSPFDLFCIAIVVLFAVLGVFRGLLRQIFGIAGFVGGIVLARLGAPAFGEAFGKDLGLPVSIATAAMALAIFIAAEIVAKLVGNFLHKRMQGGFTGAVEGGGGLLLGTVKGLLVAWAVASLVALIRPYLQHVEKETVISKLDLAHSRAVSVANNVNLITELRAKPVKS